MVKSLYLKIILPYNSVQVLAQNIIQKISSNVREVVEIFTLTAEETADVENIE